MAERKDAAVEHRHHQVAVRGVVAAEVRDERKRDDVEDVDGDHRADRAGGVDFRALLDVLRQRAAQRTVGNVDASVAEHQHAVGDVHI